MRPFPVGSGKPAEILVFYLFTVHVCVCGYEFTMLQVGSSEDSHVSSGDQISVFRPDGKFPYPVSHLASLVIDT